MVCGSDIYFGVNFSHLSFFNFLRGEDGGVVIIRVLYQGYGKVLKVKQSQKVVSEHLLIKILNTFVLT